MGYDVEGAEELVRTIRKRLAEAGHGDGGFELIIALRAPLDRDLCQRFADLGTTGLVSSPWRFIKDASLQGRVDAVKRYADEVVAKSGSGKDPSSKVRPHGLVGVHQVARALDLTQHVLPTRGPERR